MIVTTAEFKTDLDKYIEMTAVEDIFITKDGKTVAKLVNPKISAVESLRGILKNAGEIDVRKEREERLGKYEDNA